MQNNIGEVIILIEADEQLYKSTYDKKIICEAKNGFGSDCNIILKHVKEIPREKSGKILLVKNNVKIY